MPSRMTSSDKPLSSHDYQNYPSVMWWLNQWSPSCHNYNLWGVVMCIPDAIELVFLFHQCTTSLSPCDSRHWQLLMILLLLSKSKWEVPYRPWIACPHELQLTEVSVFKRVYRSVIAVWVRWKKLCRWRYLVGYLHSKSCQHRSMPRPFLILILINLILNPSS